MNEQLISLETAKLVKEKGFDIEVKTYFNTKKFGNKPCEFYGLLNANDYNYWNDKLKKNTNAGYISAPTQSLLQKWLREKHNIYVFVYIMETSDGLIYFDFGIKQVVNCLVDKSNKPNKFKTYEEALEEGLKESLKLI